MAQPNRLGSPGRMKHSLMCWSVNHCCTVKFVLDVTSKLLPGR